MNSSANALRVAGTIFALVSLGQLTRILLQLDLTIAGWQVPFLLSGAAVVFAGALSFWMWKSAAAVAGVAARPL